MKEQKQAEKPKAPLERFGATFQLFALITIILISSGFFLKLAQIGINQVYGIENINDIINNTATWSSNIAPIIFFQILAATGSFIVPGVLFAFLIDLAPAKFLKIKNKPKLKQIGLTFALFFAAGVVIDILIRAMQLIPFESMDNTFIQGMIKTEQNMEAMYAAFLNFNSIGGFLIIFLMMAILPAIGEELLFRGLLQNIFMKQLSNPHFAIFFTSFLFALIHLQLYNFPALLFMGLMLGYVYHWTQSLWYSIAAHLFNNGLIVIMAGLAKMDWIDFDIQSQESFPIYVTIVGLCIFAPLLLFYRKQATQA